MVWQSATSHIQKVIRTISCHKVPEDRVESGHGNKGVQAGLGFKQLVKFIDGGRDGGSSVPESGVKKVGAGNP